MSRIAVIAKDHEEYIEILQATCRNPEQFKFITDKLTLESAGPWSDYEIWGLGRKRADFVVLVNLARELISVTVQEEPTRPLIGATANPRRIAVIAASYSEFKRILALKTLNSQAEIYDYIPEARYLSGVQPYDAIEIWGLGRTRPDYNTLLDMIEAPVQLQDPPTPLDGQQHLLLHLMQEASEVAKAASKCLMFSVEDQHPKKTTSNREDLEQEIADFLGIVDMLKTAGLDLRPPAKEGTRRMRRVQKTEHFMRYARRLGTLKGE